MSGGRLIVRSPVALEPYAKHLLEYLKHWAEKAPGRTFLAERNAANHWRKISYRETLARVRCIAQALLDRGLDADHPVMILSENSIENGLLQLAAMYIGVPVVPVSPAYSLLSDDFGKLRYIFNLIQPGLIY
ncbi:MAG: AMP-binding protein, partial [Proteobacteria bacterium]|nr:AMP-binding protein [Pseudomonadota bacterium]